MLSLTCALLLAVPPAAPATAPAAQPSHDAVAPPALTPALDYDRMAQDLRALLGELVAADTTNPPGNEARAVKILARRFKKAGVPFEVTTFAPGRENIVARLKGDGSRKPLLLLAHLDVVGTKDQTWSTPPHTMTEKDGFLFGRGVADDLGTAAANAVLIMALHAAHVPLKRDLIVALTGDEESGGLGIQWQLAHKPETLDAEVAFNEGAGVTLGPDGKVKLIRLHMAQKAYVDFTLTAEGRTGHSSVPVPGNAIGTLGRALAAIADHSFPERLIPVERANFVARAGTETGALADAMRKVAESPDGKPLPEDALAVLRKEPPVWAQLHTTCTPTLVSGGTRANALPAKVEANVNCRLLPGDDLASVQAKLQELAGPGVKIAVASNWGLSDPAAMEGPGPAAVAAVTGALWPGVPIAPTLGTGSNDSRFLLPRGVQSYGFDALPAYQSDQGRHHGIDERVPVSSLRQGVELYDRLVRALNQ